MSFSTLALSTHLDAAANPAPLLEASRGWGACAIVFGHALSVTDDKGRQACACGRFGKRESREAVRARESAGVSVDAGWDAVVWVVAV
jgi:hypothetical protein